MKGLLRKDLYLLMKQFRFFLIGFAVLFPFLGVYTGNTFMLIYPAILVPMLSVSLLSMDEKSGWEQLSLTLPVSRAALVSARYLLLLLLTGIVILIQLLAVLLIRLTGSPVDLDVPSLLLQDGVTSLISTSLMLPFLFRLGMEKGRVAYILAIVLVTAGAVAVSGSGIISPAQGLGDYLWFVPLVTAAVYALSWRVSVVLYEGRRF